MDRATWDRAQAAAAVRAECRHGTGRQSGRWLLSGVMRCSCCGQRFWGERKRKGRVPGRRDVVTSYYICGGRIKFGKFVCPHSAHVKADDLEAWVLAKLQGLVLADAAGVDEAVERFVERFNGKQGDGTDLRPARRELAQIEATVETLLTGLDPANLPLVNDRLSQLRRRREALLQQVRLAEAASAHMDEPALRRWARERLGLLADMSGGRRDEKARQALASYVDELVIDPGARPGISS